MAEDRFWETVPLAEMSSEQWESLCDGCGRCCMHKLQNEFTREIYYTSVACRLLDREQCRCSRYEERVSLVPDCIVLDSSHRGRLSWLPDTCAYRVLDEGKSLAPWHPLVSGDPNSVHEAGISVRGRAVSEEHVHDDDVENFIIDWIPSTRMDDDVAP